MNGANGEFETKGTKIKIIGVGGAGGNAINNMIESGIEGVEYIAINTDEQDLRKSLANTKLALGHLGAGAKPEVGRDAAENNFKEIKECIKGQDMIFITAGMGGGTGTGAAPVVARAAKEEGILTVAIVTKPFTFEGKARSANCEIGLSELEKYVDTLIVIPNERLITLDGAKTLSFVEHFKKSNDILRSGVKGIAELITKSGIINLDFSDVKAIMENSGLALFGFVESREDESIEEIVERTVTNPLLEKNISGATKLLINLTLGPDTTIEQMNEIQRLIAKKAAGSEEGVENMIFGVISEPERKNIVLSLIATGFEDNKEDEIIDETEVTDKLFETEDNTDFIVPFFDREGE